MSTGQRANQYCSLWGPVVIRFPSLYRPSLQTNMKRPILQAPRIHDKARPSWYAETKRAPFSTRAKGALLCRLKLSQSYILDISSLEGKEDILEAWESMLGRSIVTEAVLLGRDIAIEVEGLIPIEVLEEADAIGAFGEVDEDGLSE